MNIRKMALIIAVVIGFSATVFGYAAYKDKNNFSTEQSQEKTQQYIKYNNQLKNKDFMVLMEKQGYYPDEIKSYMAEFIETIILYDLQEKDIKEMYNLVKKGYNLGKLTQIYIFTNDTCNSGDMKYVKKLYDEANTVETNSEYWIEEAYNRLENNKHGNITVDEIEYYHNKGITYDEIRALNVLIRKSDKKIKDMLDKKVKGESWAEISYSLTKKKDIKKMHKTSKLTDIQNSLFYSDITGEEIQSVADENGLINENAEKIVVEKINTISKLKKEWSVSAKDNDAILEFASKKLPGVSEELIKEYVKKGYSIRKLEEVKQYTDKKNISFEKYMEAVR